MSQVITFDARIDPALFIRASQLKYQTRTLRKIDWGFQVWSFVTMMLVVFGLGGAAVVTVILTLGMDAVNTLILFLVALPLAYGIWYCYHRALWHTMFKQILASPLYHREMTYRFDEVGFEMSTDGAKWSIAWAMTDDVIADAQGLFLYVGGLIYAIPASDLEPETFESLSQTVQSWYGIAQGDGPWRKT